MEIFDFLIYQVNAMNKEQLLSILSKNAVSIYMEGDCEYTVTVSHFPTSEMRQNCNS